MTWVMTLQSRIIICLKLRQCLSQTRFIGKATRLSPIFPRLPPVAATERGGRNLTSILAVTRDLTPKLSMDLGVEAGLARSAERLVIDAGVVWRMGRLWGKD